ILGLDFLLALLESPAQLGCRGARGFPTSELAARHVVHGRPESGDGADRKQNSHLRPPALVVAIGWDDVIVPERLAVHVDASVERDDVSAPGLAQLIRELVHDQTVAVLERRGHAVAVHADDLKTKGRSPVFFAEKDRMAVEIL